MNKRPILRTATVAATSALVLAALTTSSPTATGAGTTVGEPGAPFSNCNGSFTNVHTHAPYLVSTAGVITSYRIRVGATAPNLLAFKVGRNIGGTWQVVATGPLVPGGAANADVTGPVRIPVQPGDGIGFYVGATSTVCTFTNNVSDEYVYIFGNAAPGTQLNQIFQGYRLAVTADVEPDRDRDRYGDLTQDRCATDPTTQRSCAASAPSTRLGKTRVRRNGKVQVALGASEVSTFQCKVDSRPYRRCTSPFKAKLKPGKHKIRVVATDRYGNRDASPAAVRVRIPRRR